MKIGDSRPLGGTPSPLARDLGGATMRPGAAAGRTITDAVSFMGIPEAEITPQVRDALMSLMSEVDQLRREVERARQRIREAELLADHDPLLPVLNRRAFMRELSRVIAYGRRYDEPAALAYIDLDNFKQVNDSFGHSVGDAVLKHLAGIVSANIRETDVIGRLGGDEFGVILGRTDEKNAIAKANSLALLISMHPLLVNGNEIPLSISVGVVAFTGDDEPQAALARADAAMYRAKRKPQ